MLQDSFQQVTSSYSSYTAVPWPPAAASLRILGLNTDAKPVIEFGSFPEMIMCGYDIVPVALGRDNAWQ